MYMYIQQFRFFIMQHYIPEIEVPVMTLMWRGGLVAVLMLVIGLLTFNATKNKFILYI